MKNWRTSVIGYITAIAIAVYPIINTGEVDWKRVLEAGAIALFSSVAKDANVTGVGKKAKTKKEVEAKK